MRIHALIGLLLILVVPTSCGGDSSDEPLDHAEADPAQFTNAESLLEHIATLMNGSASELDRFYELCYAENELQEVLIFANRSLHVPLAMLNATCMDRFGEKWMDVEVRWRTESMEVTSNDGSRAVVRCSDQTRDAMDLHLVRLGDSWRISGYTWEYREAAVTDERIATMQRVSERVARDHDEIRRRIEAGEFATIEEAQEAYSLMQRDG